jgi:hypothetical protein
MATSGVRAGTVVEQRSRSVLLHEHHILHTHDSLTVVGHAARSAPAPSTLKAHGR